MIRGSIRGTWAAASAVALITWLGPAASAWARCSDSASGWTWSACWCYWRWIYWAALAALAWGFFTKFLFPRYLDLAHRDPPWPRQAMGRSISWAWLLASALFIALFASELHPDKVDLLPASPITNYSPMILVGLIGLGGWWALRFLSRPPSTADGP